MRTQLLFILICIAINVRAQTSQRESGRFMTYQQNVQWLTIAKSFEKSGQWIAIKQRFFLKENCNTSVDSIEYSPLMVINGVPLNIPGELSDKNSEDILTLLSEAAIEQIDIIDTLSKEWIFCKPFSGVIIVRVDKKTEKQLVKLKLH